ncbi:MAG TPA: hypothetical protein VL485_07635 [Ktedonobacteraceae bacterium]|jgi:uncharacterized membrane protein YeaQ/YmgE (transglycosylase-associated protein family)|nr:hypothetical protein [Ktedonobacteraceae bacterium]
MSASLLVFADGITVTVGNNVWTFGLGVILYLVIAAIVGFVAEAIVGGRRLPFGLIGAIIAAVIGIWLMTQVIQIQGVGDLNFYGVPLLRALIGAIIFVAIWHLLTQAFVRRRSYRTV